MTIKREFPKALLKDEWDLPFGIDNIVISDDITETSRWSEHHTLLFRAPDDGKVYEVWYSRALTEYQDEAPWEYDDLVTGKEMVKKTVTIEKYVPVEEAS